MQAKGQMTKPEKALEELANTNITFNYPKKPNTCFRETTQFKSVYKNLYKTAYIHTTRQPTQSYELLHIHHHVCYPSTAYHHTKVTLFH